MIIFIKSVDTINKLISLIENKKTGLYLRFGDGDYNISLGLSDMLLNPTSSSIFWMKEAMKLRGDDILTCIPHHCNEYGTLEEGMFPGNHEYDKSSVDKFVNILTRIGGSIERVYTNVALSYCASHNPEIVVQLHKQIKQNKVLFIGNKKYNYEFLSHLFGHDINIIYVPERDAYLEHDKIFLELDTLYEKNYNNDDYFIIIMASGCSGRAFSAEIYKKYYLNRKNFLLIDYGSLIDYLNGDNTRAYMELDPPKKYILKQI